MHELLNQHEQPQRAFQFAEEQVVPQQPQQESWPAAQEEEEEEEEPPPPLKSVDFQAQAPQKQLQQVAEEPPEELLTDARGAPSKPKRNLHPIYFV